MLLCSPSVSSRHLEADISLYGGGWAVQWVYECSTASGLLKLWLMIEMDGDILQVKELKQSAERERESEGGSRGKIWSSKSSGWWVICHERLNQHTSIGCMLCISGSKFQACRTDIKIWWTRNSLLLNSDETNIIVPDRSGLDTYLYAVSLTYSSSPFTYLSQKDT